MKVQDHPAFPSCFYDFQPTTGEQVVREQYSGLSYRAFVATMALQGILASGDSHITGDTDPEIHSALAVRYADALIKELETK